MLGDTHGSHDPSGLEESLEVDDQEAIDLKAVALEAVNLGAVNLEAVNLDTVDWKAHAMDVETLFIG